MDSLDRHPVASESWEIQQAPRTIFGCGTVERLGEILREGDARRAMVITDPGLKSLGVADRIASMIDAAGMEVTVHSEIPSNPSTASLDVAAAAARAFGADYVVALGGGSALDAAKAVALLAPSAVSAEELDTSAPDQAALPIAAIPTTAGTGAETNGFGVMESAAHAKVYIGSAATVPTTCILDPALTVGVPAPVTAATGFDAVIHAVESVLSRQATTVSRGYASTSLQLTVDSLPVAVADGADVAARSRMLLGAHLAGRALTLSGLGLVHGIGHSITATTGMAHGVALASIAEPALTFGVESAPGAYLELGRLLGVAGHSPGRRCVERIAELAAAVGLPTSLAEAGVRKDAVETIAEKTLADPVTANAPRRPEWRELLELLTASASFSDGPRG